MNRRLMAVVVGLLVSGLAGSASATLIGHYKMDEPDTITSLVDSVAGYNAGVSRGQPTSITPAPAPSAFRGVSFAGIPNDSAQTARSTTALQLTGDYTWAFWAKADASQQKYAGFFCKAEYNSNPSNPQTSWVLDAGGSDASGKIRVNQGHVTSGGYGQWDTGILLTDIAGAWHHIVVTRSGTTQTSYLDGVLKATGTLAQNPSGGLVGLDQTFNIAFPRVHKTGSNDRYYKGAMDDLGIWDNALTQNEIRYVKDNGVPEPSALALLALGGLACIRRKR